MRRTTLTIAAVAALTATQASALSQLTITSITGTWKNNQPTNGVTINTPASEGGVDYNAASWGSNPTTNDGPLNGLSGYGFAGNAPPDFTVTTNTEFDMGTFAHFNYPIKAPSLTSIDLEVEVVFDIGSLTGQTIKSVFSFEHNETPNIINEIDDYQWSLFTGWYPVYKDDNDPCPDGGVELCPDVVKATLNVGASQSFEIDGIDYFLDITGFQVGSEQFNSWLTAEGTTNTATLRGEFTATPGVVPLPGALPLLASAIFGFGWLKRRESRRAA